MKFLAGSAFLILAAVGTAQGQIKFAAISVGWKTCGIDTSGHLYCWRSTSAPDAIAPELKFRDVSLYEGKGCALADSGEAYCWKDDQKPARVPGSLRLTAITTSESFSCGLAGEGAAWCWGAGFGLGNGSYKSSDEPVPVSGGLTFSAISSSALHTCAITKDGALWCWGSSIGKLSTPVLTKSGLGLKELAAGGGPLVRAADGELYSFDAQNSTVERLDTLTSGGMFAEMDSGGKASGCGVRANGKASCWGDNSEGVLGNGSNESSRKPVPVIGDLAFSTIRMSRSSNSRRACGLTVAGDVYCWGDTSWIPQLLTTRSTPGAAEAKPAPLAANRTLPHDERARQIVVMVEGDQTGAGLVFFAELDRAYIVTAYHVIRHEAGTVPKIQVRFRSAPDHPLNAQIVDTDAGLDVAVLKIEGLRQAGIDTATIPFEFATETGLQKGADVQMVGNPGGRRWGGPLNPDHFLEVQHSKMYFESSFIRPGYSGGGLFDKDWLLVGMIVGDDAPEGQAVGLGTLAARLRNWHYPVQWLSPADPPDIISLGRLENRGFGVTADGRTYVWGQIWKNAAEPMRQVDGIRIRSLDGSCGVTADGKAFCWRQIDEGTQRIPLIVGEQAVPAPGDVVFDRVAADCGVAPDANGYCWGRWPAAYPLPPTTTEIFGNQKWKTIAGDGRGHVCGLASDGRAYCWGRGGDGVLGNGSEVSLAIPRRVDAEVQFKTIYSGYGNSCAIGLNDKTWCWGSNEFRQVSGGPTKPVPVPTEVASAVRFQSLGIADGTICGVADDQSVWCWGRGYATQPVKIPTAARFVSLHSAAHGDAYNNRALDMCGLTAAGGVYCWDSGSPPEPFPVGVYWSKIGKIDAYRHDGEWGKAEQAANEALARYPNVPAVLDSYGSLMADLNKVPQVQKAIQGLEECIATALSIKNKTKSASAQRTAWLYIASLQGRLKNLDAALEALNAAEKLSDEEQRNTIRSYRASISSSLGRSQAAIDEYRKWLAADAGNFGAMNDLAYDLAFDGQSLDEALELAERSLDDSPEDADRLDTKAYILIRLGRLDEAQRLLERAQANGASHEMFNLEHFGDLLEKQNKHAEALANWRSALAEWNKWPVGARDSRATARLAAKLPK